MTRPITPSASFHELQETQRKAVSSRWKKDWAVYLFPIWAHACTTCAGLWTLWLYSEREKRKPVLGLWIRWRWRTPTEGQDPKRNGGAEDDGRVVEIVMGRACLMVYTNPRSL